MGFSILYRCSGCWKYLSRLTKETDMNRLEVTVRTFLIILVVVLTMQIEEYIGIKNILIIYGISIAGTAISMVLFDLLGIVDNK